MAFVITEACVGVMDTGCVEVCPVDCIHPTKDEWINGNVPGDMLYINPDECIDCGACVPACPVEAIYEEDDVPLAMQKYIQINADFYQR